MKTRHERDRTFTLFSVFWRLKLRSQAPAVDDPVELEHDPSTVGEIIFRAFSKTGMDLFPQLLIETTGADAACPI